MPINGIKQPDVIEIDSGLRLRKYDGIYDFALSWYRDLDTVYLVDGAKEAYDIEKLHCMYEYLNTHGELYFIEVFENNCFTPIGDVTFWQSDMPIVIGDTRYRGMEVGKKVVAKLIERGKSLAYPCLYINEIYKYNIASQKLFTSLGFVEYEQTSDGFRYKLELNKNVNIWDKVAPKFGKIGPKYWNDFGNRLVELSSINRGARVLDIGMGRGASLFPASYKVGKDGYVIGIDNSEVMVNETNKDILHRNICNAKVINMNAQHLDFKENSFDNIICGFGFGYLLLSENKLSEIMKILKIGGEAGFSIWGIQEDQKWLTDIVNEYIPPVKKNIDKLDIPKFDTVDGVTKILNSLGYMNIKVHQENSNVIYRDKNEWWQEMWVNAVRGIFEQIESLGSNIFEEFKKDVFEELEKFNRDNVLCFNMPVIYAFIQK